MGQICIYPGGRTAAIRYAARALEKSGVTIPREPGDGVTGVLLDVPSFASDGQLRMGGDLGKLLENVPPDAVVIGGNLGEIPGRRTVDLLQDPLYQAENAYITAECALELALTRLPRTIRDCPVLIIGWGRIGKCLARLLDALGARVTVTARRVSHRAICQALGYEAAPAEALTPGLGDFRLICNTVPAPVFSERDLDRCRGVKLELASRQGLVGEDVVIARGLPGVHMPESSGALIARSCLRRLKEA